WNLYAEKNDKVVPIFAIQAEIGVPQWLFGYTRYAFLSNDRVACIVNENGIEHVEILDIQSGRREKLSLAYSTFGSICSDGADRLFFAAASASTAAEISAFDARTGALTVLKRSLNINIDGGYFSIPEAIEFPTSNNR